MTGLLLIVVLAAFGFALVAIPPWIAEQVEIVSEAGPVWVYVYFSAVGTGGAILLGCTLTILWKLWKATRSKRQRQIRGNKDPSQLTRQEQTQEIADNLAAVEDIKTELPPHKSEASSARLPARRWRGSLLMGGRDT